jgi:ABC-2 type transport system permease protein
MPIFDQGYQHWQGTLSGHGWRWLAVARHGVRVGMQNRFMRIVILLAWIPALMLAGVICVWGLVEQKTAWAIQFLSGLLPVREFLDNPTAFRMTMWTLCFHFFINVEMFFVMVLVLMVGPGLISQDLRYNALPLYFSRPVRRTDYFLGKLGVIGFFLALVAVVPAIAAWFLGVLFSLDMNIIFDTGRILVGVIFYGVVVTLSAGLLMLALSSLSRNSRYVGAIWAGMWILTNVVSTILEGVHLSQAFIRQAEAHNRRNQAAIGQNPWQMDEKDRQEEMQDANNRQMPPEERQARADARQRRRDERQREAHDAQWREQRQANKRLRQDLEAAFNNDWRPCVSYTANLLRIGDGVLGYYVAKDKLNDLLASATRAQRPKNFGPPPDEDDDLEGGFRGLEPRWPWYWSASILFAIGGLSVWILNTRVKNLDRLR